MSRRAWTALLGSDATQGRPPARKVPRAVRTAPAVVGPEPPRQAPAVQVVDMTLMGKPRMTRRDRWLKRECVLRYRAQCGELRLRGVVLPETYLLICYLPMPRSWPAFRRDAMDGTPHRSRPDRDNLDKALMDGLCPRDEHLHDARVIKRWARHGRFVLIDSARLEEPVEAVLAAHLPREK